MIGSEPKLFCFVVAEDIVKYGSELSNGPMDPNKHRIEALLHVYLRETKMSAENAQRVADMIAEVPKKARDSHHSSLANLADEVIAHLRARRNPPQD